MNEDKLADIFIIGSIITIIILKIVGVITIPWIWLLSPIWILFVLGAVGAIGITIICLCTEFIRKRRKQDERY